MYDFNYAKAQSVDDASARLKATADAKLLAGGMTLLPTLKLRLAKPAALVDLAALAELKGIEVGRDKTGGIVTIKAMTRHADVMRSAEVAAAIPALVTLAGGIGDAQVRHRGTIGLGATIVTDKREIAADEFFAGLFTTALADDEVITAVRFPVPERAAYVKFKNPASRYAIVGVLVSKGAKGVRVAVTGAGDTGVFRVTAMEQALGSSFTAKAIEGITVPVDSMLGDIHASSEYRAHLVGVMARRAVTACVA